MGGTRYANSFEIKGGENEFRRVYAKSELIKDKKAIRRGLGALSSFYQGDL
jgi:hypothetical protein